MLRGRSPLFRIWFVIFLGIAGPTVLTIVGRPVEEVFTLHALLEVIRASIGGAISATIALFVEKPRDPTTTRTRSDDPSVPGGPVEDRRRLPDAQVVVITPPEPPKDPEA